MHGISNNIFIISHFLTYIKGYRGVARNFIRGFPVITSAYDIIVYHQNGSREQSEILVARVESRENNERGGRTLSFTVQQQQERPVVAMLTYSQVCCSKNSPLSVIVIVWLAA